MGLMKRQMFFYGIFLAAIIVFAGCQIPNKTKCNSINDCSSGLECADGKCICPEPEQTSCYGVVKESQDSNGCTVYSCNNPPAPVTKEWCDSAGGSFDECGRACPPQEVCIEMCVPTCKLNDGREIR